MSNYEDTNEDYTEEDSKRDYSFLKYKVTEHDTLYGISLSFNISPELLKKDNKFSSDLVYAGQIIKIREKMTPELKELKKKELGATSNFSSPTIKSVKNEEANLNDTPEKTIEAGKNVSNGLNVLYCTNIGDVEGIINVVDSLLIFTPKKPSIESSEDKDIVGIADNSEKKYEKFSVSINVGDIDECNVMAVPHPDCEEIYEKTKEYVVDHLLQIILRHHGDRSVGKYFDQIISEVRKKDTPYACIYFKISNQSSSNGKLSNKAKHQVVLRLQDKILEVKSQFKDLDETLGKTEVPYFEFLYDKFDKNDSDLLRKSTKRKSMDERMILQAQEAKEANSPLRGLLSRKIFSVFKKVSKNIKAVHESQILTKDQFSELAHFVPSLYQTLEWQNVFSNKIHGTSYTNMLRKCQNLSPLLLIVKDGHTFSFGAYISHPLKLSSNYFGSGEMFLFSFRDLEDISIFPWSKKNSMFLNISEEGIMFGAGPQYGLWVSNDLTRGRSFKCDTFNNPVLSFKSEFDIFRIELWTVIDPITSPKLLKNETLA